MKTIVITGASRGLGFDTAIQLCAAGNRVIAIARSAEGLQRLYNDASSRNCSSNLVALEADLSSGQEIVRLSNRLSEITAKVDVLINNAGRLVNKPFLEITGEELESIYRVNVFAPFRLSQELLPLLRRSTEAHIINISSMGGITGTAKFPGLTAYSSSKGALTILTEVLAEELKPDNIAVNALALGAVQTEMLTQAFPDYKAPLSSADMAGFITWFGLNGHRFFNGKTIPVSVSTP